MKAFNFQWARSIRMQIMAAFLAMAFVLIGLLWTYQAFFLEGNYLKAQEKWLVEQGRALALAIDQNQVERVRGLLDGVFPQAGASIEWYDATGRLEEATQISSKGISGATGLKGMGNMRHSVLIGPRLISSVDGQRLMDQGEVIASGPFSRMEAEVLVFGKVLEGGGLVLAALSVPAMDTAVNLLQQQLLGLALFLALIAIGFGSLLATYITRPIAHLEASVRQVATGDFSVRVQEAGATEFKSLAQSVNHMAGALGKIDQLKDELIANVSHELRTPLGIIKGYAEMLIDIQSLEKEKQLAHLKSIADEATHLGALVNHLLDVSQLSAGTLALSHEPVVLGELLEEVVARYEPLAVDKGLSLSYEGTSSGTYDLDSLRLRQVLKNLLENALKFTPPGGQVVLRLEDHKEGLRLSISDTGTGIAQDVLEHVWDRHYKGTSAFSGSGLGLSIVKGLCDAMQISLSIASEENRGTTVFLYFHHKFITS